MKNSQLFIAVTIAFGAIFVGTCIYFGKDLGIPTELYTGKRWAKAKEEPKPRCDPITIRRNETASSYTFWCRDFEDLSIANDPAITEAKKPIIRMNEYGLNFTLETINPTVTETCTLLGTDAYEDCEDSTRCGAAGFLLQTHHDDRIHHGTRKYGISFYFDDKNDKSKEASFEFQYTCDPITCMLDRSTCTLLREDAYRGYIIPRLWRVTRFNFEFTLTISDSEE
jgi:hypothetical protein